MPHKHTRNVNGDHKHFDLAPSARAKALPAFEAKSRSTRGDDHHSKPTRKRKRDVSRSHRVDDTPRAFARLMQAHPGKKQPSSLDDGTFRAKKRAVIHDESRKEAQVVPLLDQDAPLKILPGESMSAFSTRVNQALPVGGLAHKGKHVEGIKERQTKTEKRLKKMYAEWREEDARQKEKREEIVEQAEEEADERAAEYSGQNIDFPTSRRRNRKRLIGEIDDHDADPWAILQSKRDRPKGLHDVVLAPPTLKVIPKEKFKVRHGARVNVANVPSAAGSLKRREELSNARRDVIERYRKMMKDGKRA